MMSLRQRALAATTWSGADILVRQGLQFAVSVALARLLAPEDFGTIALLYLFTGVASVFVDSGFSAALIQRQDVSHEDESTVFWFNLLIGALAALLLAAAAPAIARFYGTPVIKPLTLVMAACVFIGALGAIHGTLLTKRLDFRSQMKVGVVASVASGAVAVWLAATGWGVWALAAQLLVSAVLTTLLLWVVNPWRPKFVFSVVSARKLFGFGGYMLASGLLDMVYTRMYTVLIGRLFGVRELGYYNRADGTKQLPAGVLAGILSRVSFPVFSQAAGDPARLCNGVRMSVRMIMLVNVPAMIGMAAVAEPLVITLFGAEWAPAVPILKVLCLAGIFWPLHVINLNVLMAMGHSRLMFRLEVVKKLVGIPLLIAGVKFGVMGVAWSTVIFGLLAFLINAHYTRLHLKYGAIQQMHDALPALGMALAMYLVVSLLAHMWEASQPVMLAGLIAAGGGTYVILAGLLRPRVVSEVLKLAAPGGNRHDA